MEHQNTNNGTEAHASRLDKGQVEKSPEIDPHDPKGMDKFYDNVNKNLVTEETEASHTENVIRAELDQNTGRDYGLRKQYSNLNQYYRDPMTGTVIIRQININVVKDGYRYYKGK